MRSPADDNDEDDDAASIPGDEERLLARVKDSLARFLQRSRGSGRSAHDADLIALRDEMGEARREDVPALIAQMERMQGVAARRGEAQLVLVDPASPYFGHLRLREQGEGRPAFERDVMIGRATFVDAQARVNIVDWRHAPISQLYYRYPEGGDYEERFADRDVEGEILVRRTVTLAGGELRRIECPQGVWEKMGSEWRHDDPPRVELGGGEGTAARPSQGGVLGVLETAPVAPAPEQSRNQARKAARRQRLDRHLPEIAALIDPRQFELITARESGVVVIQGGAGSGKTTIGLHRIAYLTYAFPDRFVPRRTLVVTFGPALAAYIGQLLPTLGVHGVTVITFQAWAEKELRKAIPWLAGGVVEEPPPLVSRLKNHPALLHELERRALAHRGRRHGRAIVQLWGELLTDLPCLFALLTGDAQAPLSRAEVAEAHRFLIDRVSSVLDRDPADRSGDDGSAAHAGSDDEEVRGDVGIDGRLTDEGRVRLDLEDVAMLLRIHQLMHKIKQPLSHLFVDEAQDLSPLELSVLIGHTSSHRSVTLAGDLSQRLFLDNGFGDWRSVLQHLSLAAVAVEPLKIAYRSTREILALARHAMGPLADVEPAEARRSGAPIEVHQFPGTGAAVGFLAEALRPLFFREPRATVAIIARHPEQADRYHDGLQRAELPSLRRVQDQDFQFRPGIEVTDVRQVKGLEFDYVILVDANSTSYGTDAESRHLFHIACTRAAHQLWLVVTGQPSPLVPDSLLPAPLKARI